VEFLPGSGDVDSFVLGVGNPNHLALLSRMKGGKDMDGEQENG